MEENKDHRYNEDKISILCSSLPFALYPELAVPILGQTVSAIRILQRRVELDLGFQLKSRYVYHLHLATPLDRPAEYSALLPEATINCRSISKRVVIIAHPFIW